MRCSQEHHLPEWNEPNEFQYTANAPHWWAASGWNAMRCDEVSSSARSAGEANCAKPRRWLMFQKARLPDWCASRLNTVAPHVPRHSARYSTILPFHAAFISPHFLCNYSVQYQNRSRQRRANCFRKSQLGARISSSISKTRSSHSAGPMLLAGGLGRNYLLHPTHD